MLPDIFTCISIALFPQIHNHWRVLQHPLHLCVYRRLVEGGGGSLTPHFSQLTMPPAVRKTTSDTFMSDTEIHHYHSLVTRKSIRDRGVSNRMPLLEGCSWIPHDINGDLGNPSKSRQGQIKVLLLSPLPELTIQMQNYMQIKARCWASSISWLAEKSLWKRPCWSQSWNAAIESAFPVEY